jgi:hypothetical protein
MNTVLVKVTVKVKVNEVKVNEVKVNGVKVTLKGKAKVKIKTKGQHIRIKVKVKLIATFARTHCLSYFLFK